MDKSQNKNKPTIEISNSTETNRELKDEIQELKDKLKANKMVIDDQSN